MNWKGFLSWILGRNADEDETTIYRAGEIGARKPAEKETEEERRLRGFTVERAAGIIDSLPPDVPRESALRIVRGTLAAADIEIEDIEKVTRTWESKLNSDIELARSRQEDLRERTDEVVRTLHEEIRKAREARATGIAEEEEKVSRALAGLEEARRVRAFFGFPETGEEESTDPVDDETRDLKPFDADRTREIRRPEPLAGTDGPTGGPSTYGAGTTEER